MRKTLNRWWPAVAVLAALASTGGTGGTCAGSGSEDPASGDCTTADQCEGIPHVACLGQWACETGACQWHCDAPPPAGCKTDADCADLAGVAACLGRWTCQADATCAWICDTTPPDECVTAADCTATGAASDMACDGQWDCQGGQCVWTCVGPPWQCTASDQCAAGYACVDGTCQAVATDCVVSGCSGEVCAATAVDSDCLWQDWYKCLSLTTCGVRADGQCGWEPTPEFLACRDGGVACASDSDCKNDPNLCPDPTSCAFACINGECVPRTCVPAPETCNGVDDDCNGIVDDGCTVQKECYTDGDCAPGQACDHTGYAEAPGCCVPLPDGTGCPADYPLCPGVCKGIPVPCTADDECGPGQVCVAGTCVSGGPACRAVQPGTHGDCKMLIGWIFNGKECVSEGGCGCDPDCDAVFRTQKECQAACGSTVGCTADSDCAATEACMNGQCVPWCVPSPEVCNGLDDDCNGIVDDGCVGGSCTTDADCASGLVCGDILCGNGWCSGTCSKPQACVAVKPYSHGACDMFLGVIYDGKQCVAESGCGCGNDCAYIFADQVSCWKACNAWPPD